MLAYAVAEFKDGGVHVEVMTRQQIEAIRDRSQNVQNAKRYGKQTPWDTDTDEMWRKTALRRICKFLPKSPELAMAIALDDAAQRGKQAIDIKDAIEGTWMPVVNEEEQEEAKKTEERAAASIPSPPQTNLEDEPEEKRPANVGPTLADAIGMVKRGDYDAARDIARSLDEESAAVIEGAIKSHQGTRRGAAASADDALFE